MLSLSCFLGVMMSDWLAFAAPHIYETLEAQCRSSAGLVILAAGSQREREREKRCRKDTAAPKRRRKPLESLWRRKRERVRG